MALEHDDFQIVIKENTPPLWDHQREILRRVFDGKSIASSFGIFSEPGTGKTRTTIEILRRIYKSYGAVVKTLILAPQVVVENWRREILQFSKIDPDRIQKLEGSGKKRAEKVLELRDKSIIFITNYEGLLMHDLFDQLLLYEPVVIVFDESHRIKSPDAKRTKLAIQLADIARYRYVLSGTPVLNNYLDIFCQFRCLDLGEAFGKKYWDFKRMYFYDKNAHMPQHIRFPNWVLRPNAESIITDQMKQKSVSVKKEDCLDLPPLVRKKVLIELSKEQKVSYDSMKKHFIAFIKEKTSSADLAVTKALRLQQIVSGFLSLEQQPGETKSEIFQYKDNPRAKALEDLLNDLTPQHKVIVWACFRENYQQIREICTHGKIKYVELHGEVPQNKRDEAIDSFKSDPEVRVLIGNQGAGGIGVNLVAASYAIYFSRNFSLEHDIQSEARNHRGGSEIHEKVTRIDLVAQDTIDEEVLEALAKKQAINEYVLREIAMRL